MNWLTKTIEYSFYSLFLLVPLVFAGNTSELFEFNKMWLAFGLTTVIAFCWITKMVLEKKVWIKRTPLDIPILLFLLSQIISTIFSLDQHVSWWGYYSRFNGGLLSTITYIFLYYAFVSNFETKQVLRLLKVTLIGGLITALWGFPSHFGFDPTCLVFRGTFDTSCWTEAFKPTVRVFSTLGQPAWFAAYLAVLIPLALSYALNVPKKKLFIFGSYLALTMLFYSNLIFTNTRAGILGFAAANVVFWAILYLKKVFSKKLFLRYFLLVHGLFVITSFLFGPPIPQLYKFTLPGIQETMQAKSTETATPAVQTQTETPTQPAAQIPQQAAPIAAAAPNITDSGDIRKYVWQGAIDAWKANALFGTGVETFAFAYYKYRPPGHNLTSEWDFLYNKAHNEYLNYLTTTGLFGLGTYLAMIAVFLFWYIKHLFTRKEKSEYTILSAALVSGYISILITNFFGFSVVIMNMFLFMIPLFVFMLEDVLDEEKSLQFAWGDQTQTTNPYQWTIIVIFFILCSTFLISLARYWYADVKYALGYNLDRVNSYQDAYPLLLEAAQVKSQEAVYKDELSINLSVLATGFAAQQDSTNASQFASNAIRLSDEVVAAHPNNVVYWKNRVRLFYTLAQAVAPNQQLIYYQEALKAIQKASELAPTDAKIAYNLGVLYGQNGDIPKGIEILQQTIKLKPDYRDPYFALGLFYHQLALDGKTTVVHPEMQQKAVEIYNYLLKINPQDEEVKKTLTEWGAASQNK